MRWWSDASIRVRLTAWYVAVLTLMLLAYATATFVAVRHEFYEQLEAQQHERGASREPAEDPAERIEEQLQEVRAVLILGLPLVVALAGVGGYVLAQRALAPIDQLGAEARRVTADRLHERLSVPNTHDEIGRLAAVINDTLGRLEASFEQLRRFTADASHELRTPLAVLRGTGENALRGTRTAAEYKDTIGSMLEEADRLAKLVDALLRLARADAGTVQLSPAPLDLGQLACEVAGSLGPLAEEIKERLSVVAPLLEGP
jgi:signal transduction histidine kinase